MTENTKSSFDLALDCSTLITTAVIMALIALCLAVVSHLWLSIQPGIGAADITATYGAEQLFIQLTAIAP